MKPLLALVVAAHAAGSAFAAGAPRTVEGGIVQFGEQVVVSSDTLVEGSVVALGGGAVILGEVDEDVVAMGGPVLVEGVVRGSVFVLGRTLTLGPHAVIEGDLTTLGSQVNKAPNAKVVGDTVKLLGARVGVLAAVATALAVLAAIYFWLKVFAALGWAILGVLLAALFPSALEDASEYLADRPWTSLGAGLLIMPAVLFIASMLIVSIAGLALLPLLGIAVAGLGIWGYIAVGFLLGDRIFRRFQMYVQAWLAALLGLAIMQFLRWLPVVGSSITILSVLIGSGAVAATMLRAGMRARIRQVKVS